MGARPESDVIAVDEKLVGAVGADPEVGLLTDGGTDELPAHQQKAVLLMEEGFFPDPFPADSAWQLDIPHHSPPEFRRRRTTES